MGCAFECAQIVLTCGAADTPLLSNKFEGALYCAFSPASCSLASSTSRIPGSAPHFFPVGTRRLSSSNQFWTRIISVTGVGILCSSFIMRNRCESRDKS